MTSTNLTLEVDCVSYELTINHDLSTMYIETIDITVDLNLETPVKFFVTYATNLIRQYR